MPPEINSRRVSPWIWLSALAALSGCTVGPNYRGAPTVASEAVAAATFTRTPSNGVSITPALAQWWEILGDRELSQLIEAGLLHSPDVRAAQARLRQSRAGLRYQRRDALPKGSASASYLHAYLPRSTLGLGSISAYNAGFDATWEVDLFGGTRRAIEASAADADAAQADLADTQVQLSAEIAQAYIDLRDRQERIILVRESAEIEEQVLELTLQRRSQGVASDLDVDRVRTQVETT